MIKTWMCLWRSLSCRLCYRSTIGIAVLTFCAFSSFADDFTPSKLLVRTWSSFGVEFGSVNSLGAPVFSVSSEDDVFSILNTSTFGICINSLRRDYNFGVVVPSLTTNVVFGASDSLLNITNSVRGVLGGSVCVSSVARFPRVASLFQSTAALYWNGYRGSGFKDVFVSGSRICVNVNYPLLYADVLSSTNTVYRQILLDHISSIHSSVQNIEINTTGLQSSIDQGNNLLSNISQNSTSALFTLSDISQSSAASVGSLSQVSSNTLAAAGSLSQVSSNTLSAAGSLSQVSSNTLVAVGSLSQVSSNTLSAAGSLSQVSSNTAASVSALSDISQNTLASASALDDVKSSLGSETDAGSISYYVAKAASDSHYINEQTRTGSEDLNALKNYIGASLSGNGSPSPDNPWFPYDPNNPEDPNHPMNPKSPWNPNSPNSISGGGGQGAFTTNNVVKPLTNEVRQASAAIQSNATANAQSQIKDAEDRWNEFKDIATGDGEGLNVKIKFPLIEENPEWHVNVRDDAVLAAIENLHAMPVELTAIKDNIQWFKDGGPMNINMPSNLVDMLEAILDAITNRPENTYLLLDDYAHYISNGVYSASIEQLESDFPNVYTNLQKYGLSSSGDGNFWSLFGANLIYQSGLIGSLLDDMATIRKFADDHIEGGFAAGIKSIVEKFPSPTQLEDDLNNATNRLAEISIASTNFVFRFESVTNVAPSVFKPFAHSFDSPPSGDIVLFKTANEKYVSIPVHEQASVWSLIRRGIGFALIGVQFLLFPKFVLAVVVLFSRLSSRFVKFVPTDR